MKIGVVQTRPLTGDMQGNIANHKQWIERAVADGVELLVFPELSLTGYEPTLAKALTIEQDDPRLDDLQALSDAGGITIGAGVPTKQENGICISMLLFQPHQARRIYSKSYLHPDEETFFVLRARSGESHGNNIKGVSWVSLVFASARKRCHKVYDLVIRKGDSR
jgi:predicted amidohydrolase